MRATMSSSHIPAGWLRAHARPLLVASAAAVLYGCWAGGTHYYLGLHAALKAGATQSMLSFTATLVLALILERLFRLPSTPEQGFWLAAIGTTGLTAVWLVTGHAVAGTSNIALTIAPNLIVGATVNFIYSRALLAQARRGRL